jgi:hypothetical protein
MTDEILELRVPGLTLAKLKTLERLAARPDRIGGQGLLLHAHDLTAAHWLEDMGLAFLATGRHGYYVITTKGRKVLDVYRGYATLCIERGYVDPSNPSILLGTVPGGVPVTETQAGGSVTVTGHDSPQTLKK